MQHAQYIRGHVIELSAAPLRSLELRLYGDKIEAIASIKQAGNLYFLAVTIVHGEDGAPKAAPFSERYETFCGKPVRSSENAALDEPMNTVRDRALEWATDHHDWWRPLTKDFQNTPNSNPRRPTPGM